MEPTYQNPPQYQQHNVYAPPGAAVYAQNPYGGDSAPLAGRGTRLAAHFLDGLVAIPAFIPFFIAGFQEAAAQSAVSSIPTAEAIPASASGPSGALLGVGVLLLLGVLIYQLILIAKESRTLGKKWMGCKIVRNDGSRASFGRIVGLRTIVNALISVIPFYALVDMCFIFSDDRRCLHDRLADTKVVEG
jgi:uncharacterized RDD family membrane protein YckC